MKAQHPNPIYYEYTNLDNIVRFCNDDSTLALSDSEQAEADILHAYSGKDDKLFINLKVQALYRVKEILAEILVLKTTTPTLSLQDALNIPHPDTGISLIEYALVAGLNGFARQLSHIGVDITKANSIYDKISSLSQPHPTILDFTKYQIDTANANFEANNTVKVKVKRSKWGKFKKFIKDHKFSILIALIGVGALVAAPFTGGASAILFGIAITAGFGAIAAYQAESDGQGDDELATDLNQQHDERGLLKFLIKLLNQEIKKCEKTLDVLIKEEARNDLEVSESLTFSDSLEEIPVLNIENEPKLGNSDKKPSKLSASI